jgi:uncharacterized protein YbjT (DUF2867 family)
MSHNEMQEPTLVLGATGKTGRRVVQRLQARGIPVRAGSRSGEPRFDWEDRSTWEPVLRGARAAYIAFHPDLAVPGTAAIIEALAAQAVAAGVGRLVLLSGRGEPEAQRAEEAVQASGAAWTVVRCSWFSQNFSESFLLDPVLAGEVALPAGDVPEPFVDVEDIADVAVAALTEEGHAGRVYELTGPRLLTLAQAVGEIGAAAGRPIRFVLVSVEDFAAGLARHGVPEDVVHLMSYLFTEVLDGRNAQLADGVRRRSAARRVTSATTPGAPQPPGPGTFRCSAPAGTDHADSVGQERCRACAPVGKRTADATGWAAAAKHRRDQCLLDDAPRLVRVGAARGTRPARHPAHRSRPARPAPGAGNGPAGSCRADRPGRGSSAGAEPRELRPPASGRH